MRQLTEQENKVMEKARTDLMNITYRQAWKDCSDYHQPKIADLLAACKALVAYRDAAGSLGFQLEKADDFINALRAAIAKAEGSAND